MLLIYDADCPICRRARTWLESHDPQRRLEYVPCDSAEQRSRAPQVSEKACREAMQLVMDDGRVFAGAEAIEQIAPVLPMPWRWIGVCYRLPGSRRLAPWVYAFIARHRMALSGMLPGHTCGADRACESHDGDHHERT